MQEYVLGDASGWLPPLEEALFCVGASLKDCHIPEDIHIIHVGDLIRKGPDSPQLLELLNEIIEKHPGQWTQLVGNHETHFLTQQKFGWWDMPAESVKLLKQMHKDGKLCHSYSSEHNTHIVTHGGITHDFWNLIGEPSTPSETSKLINSMTLQQINKAGIMLDSSKLPAGPIWASCGQEVYPSWNAAEPNLHDMIQIHGHTVPLNWWNMQPQFGYKQEWFVSANKQKRIVWSDVNGYKFVSTDPACTENKQYPYQPYLIPSP